MTMHHKQRFYRQQGVVTIEFALGIPVFLFMCFAWFELCYMSYVSALTDYVVSHAARETKSYVATKGVNPEQFYQARFSDTLTQADSFWTRYVDVSQFTIKTAYFKDLTPLLAPCVDANEPKDKQIANKNCLPLGEPTPAGSAIAIYSVEYQYRPLIIPAFSGLRLQREVVSIQEYERCAFDITGGLSCD